MCVRVCLLIFCLFSRPFRDSCPNPYTSDEHDFPQRLCSLHVTFDLIQPFIFRISPTFLYVRLRHHFYSLSFVSSRNPYPPLAICTIEIAHKLPLMP